MGLLGIDRIRAHACRYSMLREVTVPSAAVSDQDTTEWSEAAYQRDLDAEVW